MWTRLSGPGEACEWSSTLTGLQQLLQALNGEAGTQLALIPNHTPQVLWSPLRFIVLQLR